MSTPERPGSSNHYLVVGQNDFAEDEDITALQNAFNPPGPSHNSAVDLMPELQQANYTPAYLNTMLPNYPPNQYVPPWDIDLPRTLDYHGPSSAAGEQPFQLPLPAYLPGNEASLQLTPGSYSSLPHGDSPSIPATHSQTLIPTMRRSASTQAKLFKEMPGRAVSASLSGPFVPQKMYKPPTNNDRRRYVENVDLEDPIIFKVESPYEDGIPLIDALKSRVKRLAHRDDTVFESRGPSISVRLVWPCYRPWSRQIPTRDFKDPPGPITRAKLAKNIAKNVERFINEKQKGLMEDDSDTRWEVGPNRIKFEDLALVSLHHVSRGSWQPHLRLRRPLP